jgi:hypothetical protein
VGAAATARAPCRSAAAALAAKTAMAPPRLFTAAGVRVCRALQRAGEFVITLPRAYHAGFSHGFNVGEAANFALRDWCARARGSAFAQTAMRLRFLRVRECSCAARAFPARIGGRARFTHALRVRCVCVRVYFRALPSVQAAGGRRSEEAILPAAPPADSTS